MSGLMTVIGCGSMAIGFGMGGLGAAEVTHDERDRAFAVQVGKPVQGIPCRC